MIVRIPRSRINSLKALNEKFAEEGKYLHATKGYRKISAAKSVASIITQEMKAGRGWYPLARIQFEIRRATQDDRSRTRERNQPQPDNAEGVQSHS